MKRVMLSIALLLLVISVSIWGGWATNLIASVGLVQPDGETYKWMLGFEQKYREHSKYLFQLIFGWTAWVGFVALVYAGIENPRRIHGNNWFAVAGVLLTGTAFVWWAWYFSQVPGAGGEVLPCMVFSPGVVDWLNSSWVNANALTSWLVPAQRCNVVDKVPEVWRGVWAYNPMMMWAGIACIFAWVVLSLAGSDRQDSTAQQPAATQREADTRSS